MFGRLGGYGAGGNGFYGGYGNAAAAGGYGAYGAGYRNGYATVAGEDCCATACGTTGPYASYGPGAYPGAVGGLDGGAECAGCACGAPGRDVLSYVGPGGDYAQETTYRYVGAGAGQFGLLRIPGVGPSCCWCLIPGLLLLCLLPLLFLFMPGTTTTTTPPPVTTMAPPDMPTTTTIDCDKGDPDTWTGEKKDYCCDKAGKGCPTTPPPPPPAPTTTPPKPTTTPCPIDCNQGYNDLDPLQWVHGWSAAKKIYCCKVANKGCASELPPPSGNPPSGAPPEPEDRVYDCDAGYHPCMHCLKESWSPKKIDWCCKNRHKGCPGEIPA